MLTLLRSLDQSERVLSTRRASLIQYLPLWERSGTTAADLSGNSRTGASTAVTLGQPGIGDGRTSTSFDGSTSYLNNYSAGYAGAWNPLEHSISMWIENLDWGVATTRRAIYQSASATNRTYISTNTYTLSVNHQAGGTNAGLNLAVFDASTAPAGLFHVGVTVSKLNDRVRGYLNGVLIGTANTLGVWSGALSSTGTVIGAISSGPLNPWKGRIAHYGAWSAELTPGEMQRLGRR